MIDHTGITASDYGRSKVWYTHALAAIGYKLLMEVPAAYTGHADVAGFGDAATGKMDFWVTSSTPDRPPHKPGIHIAFRVESRELVDAFYKAALAAGGTDNGAPGIRAHYHANYYGAFVRDPDGHNIEAVCHSPH